jgi:predicted CXXCH cytochrome family protein
LGFLLIPASLSQAAGLREGDDAVGFSGVDLLGKPVDITPLLGKKVLVLKFGSIYCTSCVKSIATLAKLQKQHRPEQLQVVGINLDIYGAFRVKRFYRGYREQLNYPVIIDEALKISRTYGVATLPSIIIIDKQGKIARTMIGYQESELEPIMEYARNMVQEKSAGILTGILPEQEKPLRILSPDNFTKTQQDSIYVIGQVSKTDIRVELTLNGGSRQELVVERPMFYFRTPVALGSNFLQVSYIAENGDRISQALVLFRDPKIGKGFEVPFPMYHFHLQENEAPCAQCHEVSPPQSSEQNFMMITQMCLQCHKELSQKNYVHGPITVGGCAPCHNFASQPERYELFSAGADLCYGCHEEKEKEFARNYIHGPLAAGVCSICHSPHGSNEKFQLRQPQGQMCLLCHQNIKESTLKFSQHLPFLEGQCSGCHNPHSSNNPNFFLVETGDELCYLCHEETQLDEHRHPIGAVPTFTFAGMKLTEEGETTCLSCHNPHASETEYLLPDKGCEACHSY